MIYRIQMKDPDWIWEDVPPSLESYHDRYDLMHEHLQRWMDSDEYLVLELDTEAGTLTPVEVSRGL